MAVSLRSIANNGRVGIGTQSPTDTLDVVGGVNVRGTVGVGSDLVVTGDVLLQSADCAEDFEADDPELVERGTVMVVGSPAHLRASSCAYDTRMAGVVSGARDLRPAIRLNHQGDAESNRVPIALLGRVMCKVEADSALVTIGDLLTTSDTPGHAAGDRNRAFGAIFGKAMAAVARGSLIPVLVALQ
ncbi:MAG: hypothetical protein ACM3ZF_05285 [Mycobacterium leprae]